jgi:two-component system chemotaxis response regulator CheB
MPPIRILIVDDSAVVRKVLCDALASDPSIQVAGTAADGRIGLSKIELLTPDLVTLDVEMPVMTGLETLTELRKKHPRLPVIMFSTLTERGAATTLDALALGASDYVTKPSRSGSVEVTLARIREELIPKIKALCPREAKPKVAIAVPAIAALRPGVAQKHIKSNARIEILAIGASTGGPNALAEVLPVLAADFPVPIVIVQHMPPLFTRLLAERLNKQSAITVEEGKAGTMLKAGVASIAPGDFHMVVERDGTSAKVVLNQAPPENSCRPAVDVLFRSVAKSFGANVLAVVLTGLGSDGVLGSQLVRERGGEVFVQDEASSVVWGMPGQTAGAGFADEIFPLSAMAREIETRVRKGRVIISPGPAQKSGT